MNSVMDEIKTAILDFNKTGILLLHLFIHFL